MALGLYPENVTTTLKLLNEIPDIICFHAGRESVDKGDLTENFVGPDGYENEWYSRRR